MTYKPKHNIAQNAIKKYLESIGDYKDISLEADHVDIKGLTHDGKWHYFEIKTASSPKLCIMEALGQILEYANFPSEIIAEKLFIVGFHKMSSDEKKYMGILREIYHLPIWYRWFDNTQQILSEVENS